MKIQCVVCNKDEASVFCSADEAALCSGCDHKVHHANKLATKHQRFSLIYPSPSQAPICDICQEKRAMLFCQQDRAILCRDCDISIHTANKFTQKHNRFLLTGLKLSPISAPTSTTTSTRSTSTTTSITSSSSHTTTTTKVVGSLNSNDCDSVPNYKTQPLTTTKKPNFVSSGHLSQPLCPIAPSTVATINDLVDNNQLPKDSGGSISSISEYLIEMLPGWQVEDLLGSVPNPGGLHKDRDGKLISGFDKYIDSVPNQGGLHKDRDGKLIPGFDKNIESGYDNSCQNWGLWVPQAPTRMQPTLSGSSTFGQNGVQGEKGRGFMEVGRRQLLDDASIVPQTISHRSVGSKRSRTNW